MPLCVDGMQFVFLPVLEFVFLPVLLSDEYEITKNLSSLFCRNGPGVYILTLVSFFFSLILAKFVVQFML